MATTVNKKMGKLYESLTPQERARMQAKLAREHKPAEMERLRNATPPEQAEAYNRALALLRVLNGQVLDWIMLYRVSMERDHTAFDMALAENIHTWLHHNQRRNVWKLFAYPITESEHRAIGRVVRAELTPLDEEIERFWEMPPDRPGLRPELAAILRERPEDGDEAGEDAAWAKFCGAFAAAIERGELKTKPRPKDANGEDDGEPWLTIGALSDWALGKAAQDFDPDSPAYSVPAVDELFAGSMYAKWEIHPDSDAEAVKARREELRTVLLDFANVPPAEWDRFPSFEPPLTVKALQKARELAATLNEAWIKPDRTGKAAVGIALSHAANRAMLEELAQAIDTITRDEFGGEDPLFPEIRAQLEAAQKEAASFADAWQTANETTMRHDLRAALGLDPYPWGTPEERNAPAPLPVATEDREDALALIYSWAGQTR